MASMQRAGRTRADIPTGVAVVSCSRAGAPCRPKASRAFADNMPLGCVEPHACAALGLYMSWSTIGRVGGFAPRGWLMGS